MCANSCVHLLLSRAVWDIHDGPLVTKVPAPVQERCFEEPCRRAVEKALPPPGRHKPRQDYHGQLAVVVFFVGLVQVIQQWPYDGAVGRRQDDQRHLGPPDLPFFENLFPTSRFQLDVNGGHVPRDGMGIVERIDDAMVEGSAAAPRGSTTEGLHGLPNQSSISPEIAAISHTFVSRTASLYTLLVVGRSGSKPHISLARSHQMFAIPFWPEGVTSRQTEGRRS
jgi:hypothetical protein